MAVPSSILKKKPEQIPTDKGTSPFSKAEKKRLMPIYNTLKLRTIRGSSLHSYISVFGEKFDLKSCVKSNTEDACQELPGHDKKGYTTKPKGKGKLTEYEGVFTEPDDTLTFLIKAPTSYMTRTQFDSLYLEGFDADEKKLMYKLFMFLFGDQTLHAVTGDFDNLRIAFTELSPYEKVPCHENTVLLNALIRAIEQRKANLVKEVTSLERLFPGPNFDIDVKRKLISDLTTFLFVLRAKKRHCILYSTLGAEVVVNVEDNYDWIYHFLRNHWLRLHKNKIPQTNDELDAYYKYIRESVNEAKDESKKEDTKVAYKDMMDMVLNEYFNLASIEERESKLMNRLKTPHSIKVDAITKGAIDRKEAPPQVTQAGGGDSVEDIREEIQRLLYTANNRIVNLRPSRRLRVSAVLLDVFKDSLENTFTMTHVQEPDWASSLLTALEYKLKEIPETDDLLRTLEHLLFLKEQESMTLKYEFRDIPHLLENIEPGRDRFHAVLRRHPSLYSVVPKDLLFKSDKDFKNSLQHIEIHLPQIYPYSNALLADIYAIEEGPNIRSLGEAIFLHMFTSLRPLHETRSLFKNLLSKAPENTKEILETLLRNIDTDENAKSNPPNSKKLFALLKALPKSIHNAFKEGISISGISMNLLFFLYLFIKFDNVLDEPSNT